MGAPSEGRTDIAQPDWMELPDANDIARFYPTHALQQGISGKATIACVVTDIGRLKDCKVIQEAPAQDGFGEAALAMSELFKMQPMTRNGKPVGGGKIAIPISFRP
jgi:protein TonB